MKGINFLMKEMSFRAVVRNLILLFPFFSFAQVTSSVDTTLIRIGEEIKYSIQVEADSTDLVLFPEGQSFSPLEMIESYKVDTSFADAKLRLIKRYGLTQFDSGKYRIPAQRVMINDRNFDTDSVLVEVRDVPVDTTKQKMFDIKPAIEVEGPPFSFIKLLYWLIALLLLAGLGYYFFRRKKIKEEKEKQLPPYEEAMEALKELDAAAYLKENKSKAYYSSLTEIVKRYIDREVDDRAMESTSDELIERLMLHKDAGHFDFDQETIKKLDAILKRADLVKFAKYKQDLLQAQSDRRNIEEIINETHEAIPEPSEEELAENEAYLELLAKRKRKRQWIYGISGGFAAIVLGFVLYGSVIGFENLKDKVFGNEMRALAEGRWYKSEYGLPAVILTTPEVLKRIEIIPEEDEVGPNPLGEEAKLNAEAFEYQNDKGIFIQLEQKTAPVSMSFKDSNFVELSETFAKREGYSLVLVKTDEYNTANNIQGVKVFGAAKLDGTQNNEEYEFALVFFISEFEKGLAYGYGGEVLQSLKLFWKEDNKYAKEIANRILNSMELLVNENEE